MHRYLIIILLIFKVHQLFSQGSVDSVNKVLIIDTLRVEEIQYDTVSISDTVYYYEDEIVSGQDTVTQKNINPVKKPGVKTWDLSFDVGLNYWFENPPVGIWNQSNNFDFYHKYGLNAAITFDYHIQQSYCASLGISAFNLKYKMNFPAVYDTLSRSYYSYFTNTRTVRDTVGIDSLKRPVVVTRNIQYRDSTLSTVKDSVKRRSSLSNINTCYLFELPVYFTFSFSEIKKVKISAYAGTAVAFFLISKGQVPDGNNYKLFNNADFKIPYVRLLSGITATYNINNSISFYLKGNLSYLIYSNNQVIPLPSFQMGISPGIKFSF